tara:strand:- start:904 stop:1449 length:546 start_codon:yes stop_codon:yes gene_type:complete
MKQLQVITGCMFAGKTTELLNRLHALKEKYLLVKPMMDNRIEGDRISTHNGIATRAIRVNNLSDIFKKLTNIKVVGIDEAQFFNKSIIQDLKYLKRKNIKVIIAGLDKDYLNKPFGCMKDIIFLSDSVTRLKAVCNHCSEEAIYSHRKNTISQDQFLIGNKNFYEALCESCFQKINCENGK